MSAEDNKATNRRFYEEVINQKHLAVLDEVAGTNYVSHSFPPGLPPGREGLKAFVSAFHTAFPDGHLGIDQMIAEGGDGRHSSHVSWDTYGGFYGHSSDGQASGSTSTGYGLLRRRQAGGALGWP